MKWNLKRMIALTLIMMMICVPMDVLATMEYRSISLKGVMKTYDVAFVDFAGNQIGETQSIPAGGSATPPSVESIPVQDGYTFSGWDQAHSGIRADTVLTAQYVASGSYGQASFVVKVDGNWQTYATRSISYSDSRYCLGDIGDEVYTLYQDAALSGFLWGAAVTEITNSFTGGDYCLSDYNGGGVYVCAGAGFEFFTVTFMGQDAQGGNAVLTTQTVRSGEAAVAPADMINPEGKSFAGWDKAFDCVTEKMIVTATYETAPVGTPSDEEVNLGDPIRAAADGVSTVIGYLPNGAQYKIIGVEGNWTKIEYGDLTGYIFRVNTDDLGVMQVLVFSSLKDVVGLGETIYLTSALIGLDGYQISYQWMCDQGDGFQPVPGANGPEYAFSASLETLSYRWCLEIEAR